MFQHHSPTATRPKRVLVLGASGFVAHDLARHLAQEKIAYRAVSSSEVDLLQPESVERLASVMDAGDAVVLTSGIAPDKEKDIEKLMKNLTMAHHIAAALDSARCAHLVYISSDGVYDWHEGLIHEGSVREAADLYGLMHIAREKILTFVAAKAKIPLCILCPCAIYGAGDTHNSYGPNRFLRSAIKDRTIALFGRGEETRDHIYIEDVSRLIALCLLHRSAGTINAVSGKAITFCDLASMVAKLVGPDVKTSYLPRNTPVTHRHFDITKRLNAFPSFVPTPLDEGLEASFRQLTALQQN